MANAEKTVGFTQITPNGTEIYFQAEPKRLYKLWAADVGELDKLPGLEVPSVTDVLGCLDKPGLVHWGQRVGVEGVLELFSRQHLVARENGEVFIPFGYVAPIDADGVLTLLKEHKLTISYVKNEAGERGTLVHTCLEEWVAHGTLPVPSFWPEHLQGYIEGLRKFLLDLGPLKTKHAEVMVGSLAYGFAGRYDLEAVVPEGREFTLRLGSPGGRRPDERDTFSGRTLFDLKTSGKVYNTHFLQLEAYELARLECGYHPTKQRVVVRVTVDGQYEARVSPATSGQFLSVLGAYKALNDLGS